MIMDCEYCGKEYIEEDPTYVYPGIYLVSHPRCIKAAFAARDNGKSWKTLNWEEVKKQATPEDNDPHSKIKSSFNFHPTEVIPFS